MFEIKVRSNFSGAHRLRGYRGRCEELHGHNWDVELILERPDLNEIGIAVDFKDVKRKLRKILKKLDHTYLNNHPFFKKNNPSAENIAKFIFLRFSETLKGSSVCIKSVTVWESQDTCATYYL